MRAISLWQPWASLVAAGAKTWETRSWSTKYRGPIAIHAALRFKRPERQLAMSGWFGVDLRAEGFQRADDLPLGVFVALAELVDVYTTEQALMLTTYHEQAFGDYRPGRFAWRLENIRAIKPVPLRGYQGLWTVPADLAALLESRVIPRLVVQPFA